MTTIEPTDLQMVLTHHSGNATFAQALDAVQTGDDLLQLLGQYVYFNATFGAGVANLAGEIGVRQNLFRDVAEPVAPLADRSMDVASDIFAAAVDEFDDTATAHRDTHRSLAQATLKGAGQFFHRDDAQLSRLFEPGEETRRAAEAVHQGYGVNQVFDNPQIFRCIGFHMGSELLADEEFRLLDTFLRNRFPELVAHLEKTKIAINGEEHSAYIWIHIHTSVEADHFAFAVAGANKALRYCVGEAPTDAKAWIIDGVQTFAAMQTRFMAHLATLGKTVGKGGK